MRISRSIEATLLLAGTIIGVGMFGIPFVFARAGFLVGMVELALLTLAVVVVHLAYAEITLRTPALHQLPGYAAEHLNRVAGGVATLSYFFGMSGTLLAYLVLGGLFLGDILRAVAPGLPIGFGYLFFYVSGVFVVFRGVRFEGLAGSLLVALLVGLIGVCAVALIPAFQLSEVMRVAPGRVDMPYGVILFALAGSSTIPLMRELVGPRDWAGLRRAIIWGTVIPACVYAVFAVTVVGIGNERVTPDAIRGIADRFGITYLYLGSVIGFLATFTSFITVGAAYEGMLARDLKVGRSAAFISTAMIPVVLFLFGVNDFITIIGAIGAIGVGLDAMFILWIHRTLGERGRLVKIPGFIRITLVLMFVAGALERLWRQGS